MKTIILLQPSGEIRVEVDDNEAFRIRNEVGLGLTTLSFKDNNGAEYHANLRYWVLKIEDEVEKEKDFCKNCGKELTLIGMGSAKDGLYCPECFHELGKQLG